MRSRFLGLFLTLSLVLVAGCISNSPVRELPDRAYGNPISITILHTNDTHGHAWPHKDRDGVVRGGFAAQSKVVDDVWRDVDSRGGVTFILSAGDVNTGVPESDLLDGEPDIMAMSRIGFDAMVLGNHEFDRGLEKIRKQQKWANFPFISANVLNKDGSYLTTPYIIVDRGIKVGILGLTTGSLKTLVTPSLVEDLTVVNPIEAAKKHIPKMKAEGAQIIVALTHIGLMGEKTNSLLDTFLDDRKLAEAVPEIQVIIGGHTDVLLEKGLKIGKTLIAQAGAHGDHIGRVDLLVDTQQNILLDAQASVLPVLPSNGEDKVIAKLMDGYKDRGGEFLDQQIAVAETRLEGERSAVRTSETNLGNLLTDALREHTGTEVAIYNGGGIRTSIAAGPIKIRDVYHVLPFSNTVVTATITGKQLKSALESGLKHRHLTGSFLQVSGIRYEAAGDRVAKIMVNGKPVVPTAKYSLSTNNFILAGGDHFSILNQLSDKKDTAIPVERVLIDYLKTKQKVNPATDGRIQLRARKQLSGGRPETKNRS